jgi:hypothetical protein
MSGGLARRVHAGLLCRRAQNIKEATAAVTRYGCRRVVFFEGSETAMRGAGVMTDRFAWTSHEP